MENSTSNPEELFKESTDPEPKCWCTFYITDDDMIMMDFGFESNDNISLLSDLFAGIRHTNFIQDTLQELFIESQDDKERAVAVAQILYLLKQRDSMNPKNRDFISPLLNEVKQIESNQLD